MPELWVYVAYDVGDMFYGSAAREADVARGSALMWSDRSRQRVCGHSTPCFALTTR